MAWILTDLGGDMVAKKVVDGPEGGSGITDQ